MNSKLPTPIKYILESHEVALENDDFETISEGKYDISICKNKINII